MPVPPFSAALRSTTLGLILAVGGVVAAADSSLRVLTPDLLELEWVEPHVPGKAGPAQRWNQVPAGELQVPAPERFRVRVAGRDVRVRGVGLKRRVAAADPRGPELQLATWLYLRLDAPVAPDEEVIVSDAQGSLWAPELRFAAAPATEGPRLSPVIHVSHEGYAAALPKKAMVGYYLGTLGEMEIAGREFRLWRVGGGEALTGRLVRRPDRGYTYLPPPYQQVWEADFSACRTPGEYFLEVPGVGRSATFRIGDEVVLGAARAYALGLYHQRCGAANALPFTRFTHAPCHVAAAEVPLPVEDHPFTWTTVARLGGASADAARTPEAAAAAAAAQLFPIVRRGLVDVTGGHHDAGDYSKYTTNSAAFVHVLVFAVDALPGVAARDDLGWPESGDGLSDLLQAAKWEADFLAKMQDEDGGFHFLVYPRDRAYEHDVPPDRGDRQVVWPKNTAATAAAVAALAQASASPNFRRHFPEAAREYLQAAERGWRFLADAHARHGTEAAYQALTHYGANFRDRDELAWAACELFLATGAEEYHRKFREWCNPADGSARRWGWWRLSEGWGNAIRSYAFAVRSGRRTARELNSWMLEACQREVDAAGRDLQQWAAASAYGTSFPLPTKRVRGGGWYFSVASAFDLAVASELDHPSRGDPRPRFLEAYATNLGYELGTNPLNLCYVTGLGRRSPRSVVHQFAQNDRRALPPSGLPVGNLQAGLPYFPAFKSALRELSFPEDGAAAAPYPYYDRWSDLPNVSTEFVIVDQARALAGLCWLAARVGLANQPWTPAPARIEGLPDRIRSGESVEARVVLPDGFDPAQTEVVWEAAGGQEGRGSRIVFLARGHGRLWVEAEARQADGRRAFAVAEFDCDDGRPTVSIEAAAAVAAVADGSSARLVFRRTGDTQAPLTVRYDLRGDAAKWSEYRRPEGDMPVEITIPAGEREAVMSIVPVPSGLGDAERELLVVLRPDEAYHVGAASAARVRLVGARGGKSGG